MDREIDGKLTGTGVLVVYLGGFGMALGSLCWHFLHEMDHVVFCAWLAVPKYHGCSSNICKQYRLYKPV